jgi:hypothetical protein
MSAALSVFMPKKKRKIDPILLDSVHGGFVNRFPWAAAAVRRIGGGPGANLRFWRGGNGFIGQRRCPGGNCGGSGGGGE